LITLLIFFADEIVSVRIS